MKCPWQDTQGIIIIDNNPFQIAEAYFADATYYQNFDPPRTPARSNEGETMPRKLKV